MFLKKRIIADKYGPSILYFLVPFLVIIVGVFILQLLAEKRIQGVQLKELAENEQRIVKLEIDYLGKELNSILGDIHFLNHTYGEALENLLANKEKVISDWTEFSTHRSLYDQIRFIDVEGNEKIRINLKDDYGYAVPQEELQNKANRYYFQETINLPKETVYISILDLNVEQDEVEVPYKPMMRFSIPVYTKNDELLGVIVLNYLAQYILDEFEVIGSSSRGKLSLLNRNSYWLYSENPEQEWGFMFDEKQHVTYERAYPEEWSKIKQGNGQTVTKDGLFTYATLKLEPKVLHNDFKSVHKQGGKWHVVSHVPNEGTFEEWFVKNPLLFAWYVIKNNWIYFIVNALLAVLIGYLAWKRQQSYLEAKYFSEYDTLTQLYNRRAGFEHLHKQMKGNNRISICFIDVNGLKQVNDVLGHNYGDELIQTVAQTFNSVLGKNDFAMRVGGDEFIIVYVGSKEPEEKWIRIKSALDKINDEENRLYTISASHGIVSVYNPDESQLDEMVKEADEKMYAEKQIVKRGLTIIRKQLD